MVRDKLPCYMIGSCCRRDPVNVCLQYGTRELSEEERHSHWTSDAMANFLTQTTPRMEKYLQQNEIFDILPDDYVELADDDGIVASTTDTNLKVPCSM